MLTAKMATTMANVNAGDRRDNGQRQQWRRVRQWPMSTTKRPRQWPTLTMVTVMMADIIDGDGRGDGQCQWQKRLQWWPTLTTNRLQQWPMSMMETAATLVHIDDGDGCDNGRSMMDKPQRRPTSTTKTDLTMIDFNNENPSSAPSRLPPSHQLLYFCCGSQKSGEFLLNYFKRRTYYKVSLGTRWEVRLFRIQPILFSYWGLENCGWNHTSHAYILQAWLSKGVTHMCGWKISR